MAVLSNPQQEAKTIFLAHAIYVLRGRDVRSDVGLAIQSK